MNAGKKSTKEHLLALNHDERCSSHACSKYCLSIEQKVDMLQLPADTFVYKYTQIIRHLYNNVQLIIE